MVSKKVKRLVAFAIIMGANKKILHKSPTYILEKFEICTLETNPSKPLDMINRSYYNEYLRIWGH